MSDLTELAVKHIKDRLSVCTQEQQDFFNDRVYPNLDSLPLDRLESPLDLIERTIAKNERGRA